MIISTSVSSSATENIIYLGKIIIVNLTRALTRQFVAIDSIS